MAEVLRKNLHQNVTPTSLSSPSGPHHSVQMSSTPMHLPLRASPPPLSSPPQSRLRRISPCTSGWRRLLRGAEFPGVGARGTSWPWRRRGAPPPRSPAGLQEQAEAAGDHHPGKRQLPAGAYPGGRQWVRRLRLHRDLRPPSPARRVRPQRKRHRYQCHPPSAPLRGDARHLPPWTLRDPVPLRLLPPPARAPWRHKPHHLPGRRPGAGRRGQRRRRAHRRRTGDSDRRLVYQSRLRAAAARRGGGATAAAAAAARDTSSHVSEPERWWSNHCRHRRLLSRPLVRVAVLQFAAQHVALASGRTRRLARECRPEPTAVLIRRPWCH
ncbi:unnamed protein product [Musa textilis]